MNLVNMNVYKTLLIFFSGKTVSKLQLHQRRLDRGRVLRLRHQHGRMLVRRRRLLPQHQRQARHDIGRKKIVAYAFISLLNFSMSTEIMSNVTMSTSQNVNHEQNVKFCQGPI
jgi:hypothetical protein